MVKGTSKLNFAFRSERERKFESWASKSLMYIISLMSQELNRIGCPSTRMLLLFQIICFCAALSLSVKSLKFASNSEWFCRIQVDFVGEKISYTGIV